MGNATITTVLEHVLIPTLILTLESMNIRKPVSMASMMKLQLQRPQRVKQQALDSC